MRTKMSEIEQLRLEKNKLTQECKLHEEEFKYKATYSKNNFGSLLLNTIVDSAKNGFSELITPSSKKKKKTTNESSSSFGFGTILATTAPLLWEILQPLLIGIAVKKAKSAFSRKKKKKNL